MRKFRTRRLVLCAGALILAIAGPSCRKKATSPSLPEPAKSTPVGGIRYTPMPPPPTPTLRPGIPTRLPSLPD